MWGKEAAGITGGVSRDVTLFLFSRINDWSRKFSRNALCERDREQERHSLVVAARTQILIFRGHYSRLLP